MPEQSADELSRKIMQLEIEEAALKKETDHLSQERLETLKQELSSLREEFAGMKAQWDNEKKSVDHLSKLRGNRASSSADCSGTAEVWS